MSDKMREDFLAWYRQQEQFGDAHQEELWKTWKASRKNLIVDLPNNLPYNQHDLDFKRIYAAGFNDALKSCTDKLQELGINIK